MGDGVAARQEDEEGSDVVGYEEYFFGVEDEVVD